MAETWQEFLQSNYQITPSCSGTVAATGTITYTTDNWIYRAADEITEWCEHHSPNNLIWQTYDDNSTFQGIPIKVEPAKAPIWQFEPTGTITFPPLHELTLDELIEWCDQVADMAGLFVGKLFYLLDVAEIIFIVVGSGKQTTYPRPHYAIDGDIKAAVERLTALL